MDGLTLLFPDARDLLQEIRRKNGVVVGSNAVSRLGLPWRRADEAAYHPVFAPFFLPVWKIF